MINKEQRPDLDMEQVQIRSQPKYHELIAPQWSKRGARPYCYQAEAEEAASRCRSDHNVHSRPSVDSNPPLRGPRGEALRPNSTDGTVRRTALDGDTHQWQRSGAGGINTRRKQARDAKLGGSVAANGESWRARGGVYKAPANAYPGESETEPGAAMGVGLGR